MLLIIDIFAHSAVLVPAIDLFIKYESLYLASCASVETLLPESAYRPLPLAELWCQSYSNYINLLTIP